LSIYSSDLLRCVHYTGFVRYEKLIIDKDLREINFGKWEGLNFSEIEAKYKEDSKKYIKNPLFFKFPEGENLKMISKRIVRFIKNELLEKIMENKEILIISHEGIIKMFLIKLLCLKNDFFYKSQIDNSHFCSVKYFTDGEKVSYILEKFNSTTIV